ncbi:LOW QUALITY PROTEIN: ankyrin repeat-containing protein At5g02620-like [Dioscorea cayenensis subsp. rotundata]|uniref:LOW QUALITY PROTEIN: ankyrin repeat-containing protein At5g02620-like n=1 Tax=Dioscorea cayennensis subsp. rotundata TaxID=55577 RepID=A0AB40C2Y8_DIOCR|nr:LOW QUALITY PROTEIN: ankyrin repeat-containing protein At5g02620-like [Dioscorea cayenensis subsp. rotundata]
MVEMEKQQSFRRGALEKLQSFRLGAMERQKSVKMGMMEKQKSIRLGTGDKQQGFREKKNRDSFGKRGDTPLHLAARAGNATQVTKLISECDESLLKEFVSKQNQDGETALYVAAENGHVEVVQEILKVSDVLSAGIKATNSFDAFHIAAKQGHLDVLKEMLRAFPALDMTTSTSNSTALDTASTQGHIDIVNLLLETGANLVKIARSNGKTALHSAARMGHVEVVKSILRKDPSIGLRIDKKGQTALHMAVKGHNNQMVLELLNPDPSVISLEDNKGNTALHIATRKGRPDMVQTLISVEGINVNVVNKAGETALGIAEKAHNEEIIDILKKVGAVATKEPPNPPNPTKQLKQTVSDIKHDVQSQLVQTRQTERKVQNIKKRLHKLHIGGLNNAINSNTVVAVLIATVAFAAIFQLPGQYVESTTDDSITPGQAYIANNAAFIIFLVFDSLALFISLAVVVVQTSLIVTEQKAKRLMVFVMNKLMWLACLFISVSFISLTYVVVGKQDLWLAYATMAIGATIMLVTFGSMCYCIIIHRIEEKNTRSLRRNSGSRSRSWSASVVVSDSEIFNNEYRKMYAL